MKSSFALLFVFAFAPLGVSSAITVNYSAGLGESIVADSGATPLDDGNAVRIGFFDPNFVSGGGLDDLKLSDLATLESNFSQFDETAITTLEFGSNSQPGSFAGEGSSSDTAFDGQKIYLWIFDTSDDAAPDATFSNVGEYGLFSSSDAAWSFPNQTDTFPTRTINTTEVDETFLGDVDSANDQLLTAVPEPAQLGLFLGLGTLAFVCARRRPKQNRGIAGILPAALMSLLLLNANEVLADQYSGGSGSEADPYQIANTDDLIELSTNASDWGAFFEQTADISFNADETQVDWDGDGTLEHGTDEDDTYGFSPIGNYSTKFSGQYDGQGHTIENLYINRPSSYYIGLFGYTDNATIRQTGLTDADVSGYYYVGGLIGRSQNNTVCQQSFCTGSVTGDYAGGLIGYCYDTRIENSYSRGQVTGDTSSTGGLVARLDNNSTVSNCYSTASVSAVYEYRKGGLVADNSGDVTASYWDMQTSGTESGEGGQGKITSEMTSAVTFLAGGWDFADETHNGEAGIWSIHEADNDGYPTLSWQGNGNDLPFFRPSIDSLTNLTQTAVQAGGTVHEVIGGGTVTARGMCWNTSGYPVVSDSKTTDGSGTGSFTSSLTGLSSNTTYYLRAYVTDAEGTQYSAQVTFTTPSFAGAGTEASPYAIATLEDLRFLSQHPDFWDKHYVQTADIDASETRYWDDSDDDGDGDKYNDANDGSSSGDDEGFSPIGYDDNSSPLPFSGTYDGQGYTIDGLRIDRRLEQANSGDGGLFGYAENADIANLGLTNTYIYAEGYAGALVGYSQNSRIDNCYATGTITCEVVGGVGGLIGKNVSSEVTGCYADATVKGVSRDGSTYYNVGGLIGDNRESIISNCYTEGTVSGREYYYPDGGYWSITLGIGDVGGLIGSDDNGTIINCTNNATVYAAGDDIGGLIGYSSRSSVFDCHSTGAVTGYEDEDYYEAADDVGGFIGYCHNSIVGNCSATGSVQGRGERVGGFVGGFSYAIIENSYSTGDVKGYSPPDDDTAEYYGGFVGNMYGSFSSDKGNIHNCYARGDVTIYNGATKYGGFCGRSYRGDIQNCYSTGSVYPATEPNDNKGFLGDNYEGSNANNFFDVDLSGHTSSTGATAKTTIELTTLSTFTDVGGTSGLDSPWDFTGTPNDDTATNDYWDLDAATNDGYPVNADHDEHADVVTGTASYSDTTTSTTFSGTVLYVGKHVPTSFGVVVNTSGNPTTNDLVLAPEDAIWLGEFEVSSQLTPETKYYYRAFVAKENETVYGDESDFTTPIVNEAPSFDQGESTPLLVDEYSGATDIDSFLAVTDVDTGNTLTWSVDTGPTNGTLGGFDATATSDGGSVTPSGLTYTPDADFSGTDSFHVQISDGLETDGITVNVTINDAPEVTSINRGTSPGVETTHADSVEFDIAFSEAVNGVASTDFSIHTDGTVSGTVAITTGADGDAAYTVTVSGITGDGSLHLDLVDDDSISSTATGTPLGGTGISDAGDGSHTADQSYTLDNTPPEANDDTAATIGEDAGSTLLTGVNANGDHLTDNDTGAAGTNPIVAVNGAMENIGVPVDANSGGQFTVNADGSVAFDPGTDFQYLADGQSETASVTVTVRDAVDNTADSTLSVTVNGANDVPVIADLDGDSVLFSLKAGTPVAVDAGGNATVSDPDAGDEFNGGYLTVTDAGGVVANNGSFSLNGATATSGDDGTMAGGETVAVDGTPIGTVEATDDGQTGNDLRIDFTTADATPANVQVLIRSLRYAAPDTPGERAFSVTVNDGDADSDPATVTVSVAAACPLYEPFDSEIPADWSVMLNDYPSDPGHWSWTDSSSSWANVPNSDGKIAIANSRYTETQFDASLFTPSLDMTGRTSVPIDVDKNFQDGSYGYGEARIAVYSGGTGAGNREEVLGTWTDDDPWEGEHVSYTIDPSGYAEPSNVTIEFWYSTEDYWYSYGFAIDNVLVDSQAPTITTEAVTATADVAATGHGTITDLGFPAEFSAHGVCWNTTGTPTTDDNHTDEGATASAGAFSTDITGLRPNTIYSVRAYATSPAGTAYGNEVTFTTAVGFDGGSGTESDPYQIANLEDLRDLTEQSSIWDAHFIQVADIDATPTSFWDDSDDNGDGVLYNDPEDATAAGNNEGFLPIGQSGNAFTGSYDGDGHPIDNLTIDRGATNYIGLFGAVSGDSAAIHDLGLTHVDITGGQYVGALVGYDLRATIANAFSTGTVTGGYQVGGLVGYTYSGLIQNSYTHCSVHATSAYAGGLVGYTYSDLSNSYSTGAVTSDGTHGGLIGDLDADATVENCFWDTESSGLDTSAGGTGLPTAEMQAPQTFLIPGWDFADETANGTNDFWSIHPDDNGGYPALAWQGLRNDIPYFGVTTAPVTDVTSVSADSGGTVIEYASGGTIAARGVCWNTAGTPTIADGKTVDGTETGAFASGVTGLSASTTYFLRAYVTDGDGTTHYGAEATFTSPPFDGAGTAGDPFRIESLEDLRFLTQNSAYWDKYSEVQNDIDMAPTAYWDDIDDNGDGDAYNDAHDATSNGGNDGWLPIGSAGTLFTGVFDGAGHALENLTISRSETDDIGLFAHVGDPANIQNLALIGVDITGGNHVGALVGTHAGDVRRCEITGKVAGADDVGGLVGINAATGTINAAYSAADVHGGNRVGGLLGTSQSGGTVGNSYSTGSVRGYDVLGGLIGHNDGGVVSTSYSSGNITVLGIGAATTGGLVATNDNGGTVTNCFWDIETSGQDTSAGGTGKTTAELKAESLFADAGWDMAATWTISDGQSRPFLAWQSVAVANGYPAMVDGDYTTRRFSNGAICNNTGAPLTLTEYGILYREDSPPVWGEAQTEVTGTDTTVADGATLAVADTTLDNLPLGSTWYASGYATDGTSVWYGDTIRIEVPNPSVLPHPVGANDSTIDTTPEFTWSGDGMGTVNYTLYLGTTPNPFENGTTYDAGSSQSLTLTNALTPGTTYYWGVEVIDDVGTVQSIVQPLTLLNQDQGGDIVSGFDNANSISDTIGGPIDIRLADIDGDGDPDLVAASRPDNAVVWYENTDGAGTFGPAQVITTNAVQATRVQVGDLDKDGDLDVMSTSAGDDEVAWYANDGAGGFGPQQVITTDAAGARDLVLFDQDGDGDLDVATASFYDNTIAWHKNDGAGNFGPRQVISAGSLNGPAALHAADLNGDGAPDITVFSKLGERLVWYRNSGAGGFGSEQEVASGTRFTRDNIDAADLDGDGDLDLLLGRDWYENMDGAGSFSTAQTVSYDTVFDRAGYGDKAIAADLDGDGVPDVLTSGPVSHPSGVMWHGNDAAGNFDAHSRVAYYGAIGSRTPIRVGDIDGDGDLDVVAASRVNRRIDWYENRHGAAPFVVDGVPEQTANVGVPYTYTIAATAFDDLDDGDALDYTAQLADDSPLPGWLSFDSATATFSGTPTAGDVGDLDIAVTAEDTTGAVVTNTFTLAVIDAAGAPSTQVTQTGDSGAGSLRQVIADAAEGDTITFAPELSGNTITLTSGTMGEGSPAIKIEKGLTIDGDLDDDGTPDITISGNQVYGLLDINDGEESYSDVILDGLVFTDAWLHGKFGDVFGAITTAENLEMHNCVIKDASVQKMVVFSSEGETILNGCEVKNNTIRDTWPHTGPLTFDGTRAEVRDCDIHGNSGYYLVGAGIHARCDLTVQNTILRNNVSMFGEPKYLDPALDGNGGGGIYFAEEDGDLLIEDSVIAGNSVAVGQGGGVRAADAGCVIIRDSRIIRNYSTGNGGLKVNGGELTLERSTVSGNTCASIEAFKWGGGNSDYWGAGIWLNDVDTATIDACTISDNMTPEFTGVDESPCDPKYYEPDITGDRGGGSGIYGSVGTLTLRNSTLSGNTTYAGLGAVHRADTGTLPEYNIAAPTPGGLYLESGDAVIQNCTFAENAGGGVIIQNGTYTIESSIFSGNIQSEVGGTTAVDIVQSGGTLTVSNSLVQTANGGHNLIDGTDGNIVGHDPLLAPLDDNGGPTLTRALLPTSPAIDAGSNPSGIVTDQRGANHPRTRYEAADMGAFEVQLVPEMPEIDNQQAIQDTAFTFTAPEGGFGYQDVTEELTYAAALEDGTSLPDWLSFAPETRTFSGTPGESDLGTVSIAVTATDARGATATQVFDLTVTPPVNEAPSLSLGATSGSLGENNTPNTVVTTITVEDDGLGTNQLSLSGADAGAFGINGTDLEFTAVADFETKSSYEVTVEVNDSAVGGDPDDSATFTLTITDGNEPPTVSLSNTLTSLPDNTDTSTRVKVADIDVTDDALGSPTTSLGGTNAGSFLIDGVELFLQAGTNLDAGSNSELTVIVEVDDSSLGAGPEDTATLNILVTDATAPTVAVDLQVTADCTPALSGTVDDPNAAISVTVDGQTHPATNNGATWILADDTLTQLAFGTYDVAVTATDAAGNSGSDATADELEIVTDWEKWRRDHFTGSELADPAISGPEANPDGDARDNLFEFLHFSDPMVFNMKDPVRSELNGSNQTEWSFARRIDRSGTTLTVRVSSNPDMTGATVLSNPETTAIDAGSETVTYTDDTAVSPDAPRYFRIEITAN